MPRISAPCEKPWIICAMGFFVGIAPERTRSRESEGLLEGKQGAALLPATCFKLSPLSFQLEERIEV